MLKMIMNLLHTNNLFIHNFTKIIGITFKQHTRPRSNNIPIEQIVNEVTTSQQPEKEQTPCSSIRKKAQRGSRQVE